MGIMKITAPIVLALIVAGCQPAPRGLLGPATKAAFSEVNPALPPGWSRYTLPNGAISFACPSTRCAEPGEIRFSAMTYPIDVEQKMRNEVNSIVAVKNAGNSAHRALDSSFKQISIRNTTNADSAGYERTFSRVGPTGIQYTVLRTTMAGNESRIVSASASTLANARKYLATGLAGIQ